MAPKLYASKRCRSDRVMWLAKELDIPLDVEDLKETQFKSPDYLKINPLGQVPALVDGDGPPILESGAIVQYLQLKYGGGRLAVAPSDARFGAYLQWLWAGEATLMPCIDRYWVQWFSVPDDKKDDKVLPPLHESAKAAYGIVERAIAGKKYILGDEFTAADIMVGYAVSDVFEFKLLQLADFPNLKEYLARLATRPACPSFDAGGGGAAS